LISIIIPTKNNGDILGRCLSSIEELDWPEDQMEIIIVDGRSTDNTIEIAKEYGSRVIYEDVGTRGGACNVGVRSVKGEFIVFTDADCVVPEDWLKNLIKHFNSEDVACVGGPNITPEDDTNFAKCVGEVLLFLSKPGSRYGLDMDEVVETFHNSGCNVAYRKSAIEEAGWFNEKLITCEDEELDYRILKKGYRILYTPDAKVDHYRRPTWKGFLKQAYRYAIGRMQAIKLHRKMGRWYHWIVPALILSIVALFALSFVDSIYPLIAFSILVIVWSSGFGYFRGMWK
jgi:cellulose synthase/poly-beta-1,6-N-acetylglucosamine synthase-like glycosyltransferase